MTELAVLPTSALHGTVSMPATPVALRVSPVRIATVLGPAFVAAIAYLDPGNFATNFQGGASFGYRLMWVVLAANLVAMPIQYLAAKLGIVTGRSLPEACRASLPTAASVGLWLQAEVVAMATDLAEFVGAAIGLNLLFHMPLPAAGLVTAVISFGVLAFQRRGHRAFEVAIGALMALVCAGFLYETLRIGPSASGALGGLRPTLAGKDSVLLAVGIIGATVMPHAVYLHSALTSRRITVFDRFELRRLLHLQRVDVVIALGVAGLVNMSMLAVAAKLFHGHGVPVALSLQAVHAGLGQTVGGGAALTFAVALLASGISSSTVGTCAGQVIMDGFIRRHVSVSLRRLTTMAPALVLLCTSFDPTRALVLSQVVLSFGIPFALVPLLMLTSNRRIMGDHVNSRLTTAVMGFVIAIISGLNVFLLCQQVLA
jgi:manganese transport protein